MSKEAGRVFANAIKMILKAFWSLFVLSVHVLAKTLEALFGLISKFTAKMLN